MRDKKVRGFMRLSEIKNKNIGYMAPCPTRHDK